MQSSFVLMCNGAFICIVCLIREIPPMVKRTRKPSAGYLYGAFLGFSMFSIGLANLIFGD